VPGLAAAEPHDVYIGRAGKGREGTFGNPHPMGFCPRCGTPHDRAAAIAAFKREFWHQVNTDAAYRARVLTLRGKRLACFCKRPGGPERACHGDVYIAWFTAGCPLRADATR
jgi:hypothetical protein